MSWTESNTWWWLEAARCTLLPYQKENHDEESTLIGWRNADPRQYLARRGLDPRHLSALKHDFSKYGVVVWNYDAPDQQRRS
jgi:hypothetical protein